MRRADLTGKAFGRWTVVSEAASRTAPSGGKKGYWNCVCQCGATKEVRAATLVSGRTKSCGCLQSELAAERKFVHGARHTAIYEVWTQMLQRCGNKNNTSFERYGGRGIVVCDRWHDFAAFYEDNASFYSKGLTIDRKDNDGNYEPGNVRWVTNKVNCRNQRRSVLVAWEDGQVHLNDLAEKYGVKLHTAYSRYQLKGWTPRQSVGLDSPPKAVRQPISEMTRKRMSEARAAWHQRRKA